MMNTYNLLRTRILSLYVILMVIILYPSQANAQNVNWDNEIEQGFTKFQEGDWAGAFVHLEKISNALSSIGTDTDIERTVYFACGLCTQQMGELNKSIAYNSKALELPNTPIDMTIQLLGSQLHNYSELSMKDNCEKAVDRMMEIYKSYRYIDLAQSIMTYYSEIGNFNKVIEFETDLSRLIIPTEKTEMEKISNAIQLNTIYMCLAHSYMELKDFTKALQYYNKSLETVTEYNKNNLSLIYAAISQIYDIKGNRAEALKYQKLAVESEL